MTSVSVSLEKLLPAAARRARSSAWFSMMPLWTTATRGARCGWALDSEGRPWVAQRVWPMPQWPVSGAAPSWSASAAILPLQRTTSRRCAPGPSPGRRTATPAES
jgi:hypothetical protein